MSSKYAAVLGVLVLAVVMSGCEQPVKIQGPANRGAVREGAPVAPPVPDYGDLAARYNERIRPIQSLYSTGTVRLTYLDENREKNEEQGDATLQVVLPDQLGLSLKKAGKRLFWLGGNSDRYWWFDLVTNNQRTALVGRHDTFDAAARNQIGLAIHPRDLIRVLGILPLPVRDGETDADPGAVQRSDDGRLLVTTPIRDGGTQRLWLDPQRLEPQKIELFDADGILAVTADLEEYDYLPIAGVGGGGPRVARRISVRDIASETEVRLTMGAPESGTDRINPNLAFNFEALRDALGVDRVTNLDEVPRAAAERP